MISAPSYIGFTRASIRLGYAYCRTIKIGNRRLDVTTSKGFSTGDENQKILVDSSIVENDAVFKAQQVVWSNDIWIHRNDFRDWYRTILNGGRRSHAVRRWHRTWIQSRPFDTRYQRSGYQLIPCHWAQGQFRWREPEANRCKVEIACSVSPLESLMRLLGDIWNDRSKCVFFLSGMNEQVMLKYRPFQGEKVWAWHRE